VVADDAVEELVGVFRTRAYRVLVRDLEPGERRALERSHGVERWDETPEGLRFEVTIEGSRSFYDLIDRLENADAELLSVTTVEPDLEDAFLRLTERGPTA
jgi:ABC-2 type transport system ATP-binding protein